MTHIDQKSKDMRYPVSYRNEASSNGEKRHKQSLIPRGLPNGGFFIPRDELDGDLIGRGRYTTAMGSGVGDDYGLSMLRSRHGNLERQTVSRLPS